MNSDFKTLLFGPFGKLYIKLKRFIIVISILAVIAILYFVIKGRADKRKAQESATQPKEQINPDSARHGWEKIGDGQKYYITKTGAVAKCGNKFLEYGPAGLAIKCKTK